MSIIQAYPAHESKVIGPPRCDDVVNGVVEDGDRSCTCCQSPMLELSSELTIPVTPTITKGWAARMEKTTDPRTEDRSTSLTPKLMAVFENISRENAKAGMILHFGLVCSSAPS